MATSEPWEISLLSGWTWRWRGAYAVVGPTEWAHNLARLWTHLSVRARGKGEKQMADTKRNETTPPPKTRDPHRTAEVVPKSHPATRPRAKTKGKRNISGPRLSHSSPRLCCSGPESILRNCFTGCYRPLSHSSALIVVSQQLQHDRQSSNFFFVLVNARNVSSVPFDVTFQYAAMPVRFSSGVFSIAACSTVISVCK